MSFSLVGCVEEVTESTANEEVIEDEVESVVEDARDDEE